MNNTIDFNVPRSFRLFLLMDFQRKLRHTPILRQTMQDFVQSKKSVVRVCVSKMEGPCPDKFAFSAKLEHMVDGRRPVKS